MTEEIFVREKKLILFSEKAVLWESLRLLLISDMHLGKINHFRRSGIPVPHQPNDENIERLIKLLQNLNPERVIFMGDLFHSHYNPEWEVFGQVLRYFPAVSFELVQGNHDIMSDYQYVKHQLVVHNEPIHIDNVILSHEPLEAVPAGKYNIAGHVHPGVKLRGKGRQGLRLPCFYFGTQQALLPAFGEFTGMHMIKPQVDDQVFVIVEGKVIKL